MTDTPKLDLPNACVAEDGVLCGGQPSEAALQAARDAGYETVINLRRSEELGDWDEKAVAERLGLRYESIPIGSPNDLSRDNAERLDRALSAAGDAPVLVHCGSCDRVGALFAVRAAKLQGLSTDEAIAAGRRAGLSGLEEAVRQILE